MKPEQNNMNTPTPSLYATDGQRTTDAECWMNYCLEAEKELTAAREELETERIRLAACGVVAMADTKESRTKAREMLPEYRSASLSDVERRVDECIELREQWDRLAVAVERIANNNIQDAPETDYAYELGRKEGIAKIARCEKGESMKKKLKRLASVQKASFAGVVIIMASIILPWFWIKLALLCSSLVLAVGCLLVLIRRISNSSTNDERMDG